jgi:hypothetical protein
MNDLESIITRARELLKYRHAAMATVNADGTPHNTPFRFMYDHELEYIFWGSHPESLHSQNVSRTGNIFVVVYDAMKRGGLYIKAASGHILGGRELTEAISIHNRLRAEEGQEPLDITYYSGDSPQRMWGAKIVTMWVNSSERDETGKLLKDIRLEITAKDLI